METISGFILHLILVIVTFAFTITILYFGWQLVMYATGKDNDQHRAHAKVSIINATFWLVFLMVAWYLAAALWR